MAANAKRIKLNGSTRQAPKGSRALSKADEAETMEVTLRLRPKVSSVELDRLAAKLGETAPKKRQYLTRAELTERYGASPADVKKVEDFAHANKLTVKRAHLSSRVVKLTGAVEDVRKAFGVVLKKATFDGRTYRVRQGAVSIPKSLAGIVVGVHGIDNRPVAKPHLRQRRRAAARNAQDGSLTVAQIAKLYNFPSGLTGKGQCVAIIELNGFAHGKAADTGYEVSDLQKFFAQNGIAMPEVVSVGVDGGANLPGRPDGGDDEVTLDIEVAAAVARGARYAVYFAPNTTNGFIDAVKAAVHDDQRKPSVISISWGGPEDPFGHASTQFLAGLNEAFRDAALLGVTVCVAAGDDGAPDMGKQGWDGKPHTDFPSSSPYALACGGTKLVGSGATIESETVWNEGARDNGAGGGGVSNVFARPDYQAGASIPLSPKKKRGRGVPDVAGNADPATGYKIFVGGRNEVIGGTSAVAPLIAGLVALINEQLTKAANKTVGFVNPLIYAGSGPAAFRDITNGDNDVYGNLGKYAAGAGWDACTGLGVPDGKRLLSLLT
ncbi:MAG: S8/S53 family peptidase [Alphaproteobacteria bacterium]|nr:S8/S53 family peptidase [Alphaproteobacteria bacterium]